VPRSDRQIVLTRLPRLRSSLMIEINCRDSSKKLVTVRLPEALACSLSGRISTLVGTGTNKRRELSVEELLGGPESFEDLEDQIADENGRAILDYLTWFVQWLYTSKLNYNKDLRFFDMWLFASKIDCPKLQNEAMRMLSRDALWRSSVSLEEKKRQYFFANSEFHETLLYCIDPNMFSNALEKDGFDKNGKLEASFWKNRKCWLFLLDCAAYFGPGDRRVRSIFGECESMDIQIIKRMIDLAKEGGDPCPWDPKNIARYLVAEPARDGGLTGAGFMLAPVRKHEQSPSGSNESKKRPKHSLTPEQHRAMIEFATRRPSYPEPPRNSSPDGPA